MSDQDEVGLANQSDVRTLIEWALNAPIVLTMADPGHICKCSLGFPYLPYGAYQPEDCLQNTCRLHLYIYISQNPLVGRKGGQETKNGWGRGYGSCLTAILLVHTATSLWPMEAHVCLVYNNCVRQPKSISTSEISN